LPIYSFRCKECKKVFDNLCNIADRNKPTKCDCGGEATRDVEYEVNHIGRIDETCKEHERYSLSMGVPTCQVNQFRKMFPNSTYRDDGALLIKSRKDKIRQMKERNMEEMDRRQL